MRDSVWVIYKGDQSIGVAATEIDAIRYLVDVEWIKLDRAEIEHINNEQKWSYLTVREAARKANTTIEKILGEALKNNNSSYSMINKFSIFRQRIIHGYNTPVE